MEHDSKRATRKPLDTLMIQKETSLTTSVSATGVHVTSL